MKATTQSDLLKTAYARTHSAADVASTLWQALETDNTIKKEDCTRLARLLREAYAAAVALEEIMHGIKPPKIGD